MEAYQKTAVDDLKASVDFRLIDIGAPAKAKNTIHRRSGEQQSVSDKVLRELQTKHTRATDF